MSTKIKYYIYNVDFAMRGTAQIQGVLWLDWSNLELFSVKVPESTQLIESEKVTEANQEKFTNIKEKSPEYRGQKCIAEFADLVITCPLKDFKTEERIRAVQIYHHTKCYRKKSVACRFFYQKFPTRRTIIYVPFYHLLKS